MVLRVWGSKFKKCKVFISGHCHAFEHFKYREKDFLVLDEIPDLILFGHTHNQEITNYKSITILNPGSLLTEFVPTIIDLETRNYEQRRF